MVDDYFCYELDVFWVDNDVVNGCIYWCSLCGDLSVCIVYVIFFFGVWNVSLMCRVGYYFGFFVCEFGLVVF